MRITLLIAGAAIAGAAAAAPTTDPLSAWLYNLKLPLPDAHGVVDGVDVSLTQARPVLMHKSRRSRRPALKQRSASIQKTRPSTARSSGPTQTSTSERQRPRVASLLVKKATSSISSQCVSGNETAPYIIIITKLLRRGQGHSSEGERGLTGALLNCWRPGSSANYLGKWDPRSVLR